MKSLNILALDPSTTTGFCILDHEGYGVLNLSTKKGDSQGVKWLRLEKWLEETCTLYNINLVAMERVSGRHHNGVEHHAKLLAIIELYCTKNNINYVQYSATEIKKFATGKGNASKGEMIQAAFNKFNYKGLDDNEADAIHIFSFAKHQFT